MLGTVALVVFLLAAPLLLRQFLQKREMRKGICFPERMYNKELAEALISKKIN